MVDAEATTPSTEEAPAAESAAASTESAPDVPPEMKRALQKANKEAETLRLRLKEIEDRDLSELQRAQKDAADARSYAEKAQGDALRYRIAAKHSISDEDAELFLTGADEETLLRQAARLKERTPTGPVPDLSQGAHGNTAPTARDIFADFIKP